MTTTDDTAGSAGKRIPLFTSIPPPSRGRDGDVEQTQAFFSRMFCSFEENGFAVNSVNFPREIETVRLAYSGVDFHVDETTDANFPGRYGPSIGSILSACQPSDYCAICNADIFMLRSDILNVIAARPNAFLVARRLDVEHIGGDVIGVYRRGNDAVFFDPQRFVALKDDPLLGRFRLGAPFWDIVIPIAASFHGDVAFVEPPFLLHPAHHANWSRADYRELQNAAVGALVRHARVYSARSDRAALFLRLFEEHVGTRGSTTDRRAIKNSMMVFDAWLKKIERDNPVSVRVELDAAVSAHSRKMIAAGGLPEVPMPAVPNRGDESASLSARWRRRIRTALRERKRKRTEKVHAIIFSEIEAETSDAKAKS